MPPGRALAEFLFGGSAQRIARQKAPAGVRQAGRNGGRNEITHGAQHAPHNQYSTNASGHAPSASTRKASGKLVNYLVEVFAPLVRAPGAVKKAPTSRHIYRSAEQGAGRRLLLNRAAGLHTASRPHASRGFGGLKPPALPRSTAQTGLGSVRNFSSSRAVFENVVQNAPLGLRILGDSDQLDMRALRREMKQAQLKRCKQESKANKGKGRMTFDDAHIMQGNFTKAPAGLNDYFPVNEQAYAASRPTVQLVLPLNPVKDDSRFLSIHEEAQESRFFSAMLMSDLRLLHDMYGRHHAKMRNIIQSLESAGCFEPDAITGQPSARAILEESEGKIYVTFYGDRWTTADVRQILGYYETAANPWFELRELANSVSGNSFSDYDALPSVPSSLASEFEDGYLSMPLSRTSSRQVPLDDTLEYERVQQSLYVPPYSVASTDLRGSYASGVNGFLRDLDTSQKPAFAS